MLRTQLTVPGYKTFFPQHDQYPLRNAPPSWARVPAMRHAMTLFPGTTFFWYLDATALIMNPSIPLHSSLLTSAKLESLMITNAPVVPPDSVIKTFANLKGDRIDFVVTQDKDGLAPSSFVLRNGEWAKYFLDVWFDPIYRSYNFQKAEFHALEHIVQYVYTRLGVTGLWVNKTVDGTARSWRNSQWCRRTCSIRMRMALRIRRMGSISRAIWWRISRAAIRIREVVRASSSRISMC
jgi:hypothetical protein